MKSFVKKKSILYRCCKQSLQNCPVWLLVCKNCSKNWLHPIGWVVFQLLFSFRGKFQLRTKEFLLCHVTPEIFSGTRKLVEFATRPEVTTLCQLSGLTEYIQPWKHGCFTISTSYSGNHWMFAVRFKDCTHSVIPRIASCQSAGQTENDVHDLHRIYACHMKMLLSVCHLDLLFILFCSRLL